MRNNKLITKGKLLRSFIKFSQLIILRKCIEIILENLWIMDLKGLSKISDGCQVYHHFE